MQSLYQKIEDETFDNQQEAIAWGKQKKAEYKAGDQTVKVDTNPVDATRRRWKTEIFLKV